MKIRDKLFTAGAAFFMTAQAQAQAPQLTFTSWGGSYQNGQESTTVRPFASKFKVNVKTETYNGGIAQIRSQVQTGKISWDVVDMQLSDAIRACDEGLLEKINPAEDLAPAKDGTKASQDYFPRAISECLAGNISWSTVLVFNTAKVGSTKPSKVADFFNLERFPGKRGLRKSPEGALEWALLADGVPTDQVYKVLATSAGMERAFRKLDTIKSSVVWWESGAQPAQLLADGEVVMTSSFNGRIYSAIAHENKPFGFIWDGQIKNIEGYAIVKGTRNLKEAKSFVRFATEPERLAAFAEKTAYGPLRKSAIALIDTKTLTYLPTAAKNLQGAVHLDPAFWAHHAEELNQKFLAWLNQ